MRILYVTLKPLEFNTSATLRNLAMIEGITSLGHSVEILTIPATQNSEWLDTTLAVPQNCEISYLSQLNAYVGVTEKHDGFVGKLKKSVLPLMRWLYHKLSIYDFTIMIAKKADKIHCRHSNYDIIISSSDPKSSHIAVRNLLRSGLKCQHWIQYWGDPLAFDITNQTIWPTFILKMFEQSLIKEADKVVYVSPFTLQQQQMGYRKVAQKLSFLPIPYRKINEYALRENYPLDCCYLGDYYTRSRNILPFVEAVQHLELRSVIAGNTDIEVKGKHISVLNRISQSQVTDIEQQSRILVCLLNRKGNQIPGKLYHYAASNKPILVIVDGDESRKMEQYLLSFDRFELCVNDSKMIEAKLNSMLSEDKIYKPSERLNPSTIAFEFLSLKNNKE
ncbi:MAG: hypothetical protein CVU96_03200 [Firmicutes bacterium HGW-Firmicutes-20]|nr:MAG: hypothetical protein CVU96_03200 [Firmicutes bacterium HGW-Firmicutes-20]PKM70168.1 MAG: hypothetical protein CVU94_00550 [Firmicutes bacterium HGW-Firmicutes-19]